MKLYAILNEIRDVPIQKLISGHPEIARKIRRFQQLDNLMKQSTKEWMNRSESQRNELRRQYDELERDVNSWLDKYGYRYGEIKDYLGYLDIDDKLVYSDDTEELDARRKRMAETMVGAVAEAYPESGVADESSESWIDPQKLFPYIKATKAKSYANRAGGVEWDIDWKGITAMIKPMVDESHDLRNTLIPAIKQKIETDGGKFITIDKFITK